MDEESKLTPKQQRFAELYIETRNATEDADRVYKPKIGQLQGLLEAKT